MTEYLGRWVTDAPLTPEQVEADRIQLANIWIPRTVIMRDATVYVDGHEWQYRSERIRMRGFMAFLEAHSERADDLP